MQQDRHTDAQTVMTKLIVALGNFTSAPKMLRVVGALLFLP